MAALLPANPSANTKAYLSSSFAGLSKSFLSHLPRFLLPPKDAVLLPVLVNFHWLEIKLQTLRLRLFLIRNLSRLNSPSILGKNMLFSSSTLWTSHLFAPLKLLPSVTDTTNFRR